MGQYEGDMLSEAQYWRRFPTGVVRRNCGFCRVANLQYFKLLAFNHWCCSISMAHRMHLMAVRKPDIRHAAAALQSDYCIRIDNEWTIDGAERAKDSSSFSACHMNHAGGAASNVGRLTIRKQRAVRFYAKRDIQVKA